MSEDLMTIRQMCDAFDVTPRTLRFYEARELIFPQRRGQHRLYDRRDRARLILILRGKRFGFSLEQIRQLLELYEPGGANRAQIAATIDVGRDRCSGHGTAICRTGARPSPTFASRPRMPQAGLPPRPTEQP